MPFVDHRCSVTDTLIVGYIVLEFIVEGTLYPGEAPVMYYSDDSGNPGCSADFEVEKIICQRATGEGWDFLRSERPDWFRDFDQIITDQVLSKPDYERECLEQILLEQG